MKKSLEQHQVGTADVPEGVTSESTATPNHLNIQEDQDPASNEPSNKKIKSCKNPASKRTSVPYVVEVDITKPHKIKKGEGYFTDHPSFMNISYPVSAELPGLDFKYYKIPTFELEKERWALLTEKELADENTEGNDLYSSFVNIDFPDLKNPPFWFNPSQVSRVENLFIESNISKCENYLAIRNIIIQAYLRMPQIYISISSIGGKLTNIDISHISQIHAFLETWGLINSNALTTAPFCLSSEFVGLLRNKVLLSVLCKYPKKMYKHIQENTPYSLIYTSMIKNIKPCDKILFQSDRIKNKLEEDKNSDCEYEKDNYNVEEDYILDLGDNDKDQNCTKSESSPVDSHKYPCDDSEPDIDELKCYSNFEKLRCFICTRKCVFISYCNLQFPFVICAGCFKVGRFPVDMTSSDFVPVGIRSIEDNFKPQHDPLQNCEPKKKDMWSNELVLNLLDLIEKTEPLNWVTVSKNLNLDCNNSAGMNLRNAVLDSIPDETRQRKCRQKLRRNPPETENLNYDGKESKKIRLNACSNIQKFITLPHPDFAFDDSGVNKSLLECSENLVMTVLIIILRLVGSGIAAEGAKKGLEYISEYVESHKEKNIDILQTLPPESDFLKSLAIHIIKSASFEAKKAIDWENNAVEILVQQLIELQYRRICCKTNLMELLD